MSQPILSPSPMQILEQALRKERASCDFYANLAADCKVVFLSELLIELKDEEAKHVKMIQAMITQLKTGMTLKLRH